MKNKLINSHLLLALMYCLISLFFTSCEDNDNIVVKYVMVEIDSEPGVFHGHPAIMKSGVYMVNEPGYYIKEEENNWRIEPQTYIKGFSFEPGYYYKLRVRIEYDKEAYGGSPIMSLIKILEKKETESVRNI